MICGNCLNCGKCGKTVVNPSAANNRFYGNASIGGPEKSTHKYVIAVDIGTTTVAVSLNETAAGGALEVYSCVNGQRRYGADVLSRAAHSVGGKKDELQRLIREDVLNGIRYVTEKTGVSEADIGCVSIACNTVMTHLLLGYPCDTLGVFPFVPHDLSMKELTFGEAFGSREYGMPVLVLPGISAFVGADVAAGLACLGFNANENVCMLIDLGTNGEIALGNKDKLYVTSTAAGPAFEGNGNYGSDAISVCAKMLKDGLLSVNGTVLDNAKAGIKQEHMRGIQLAKAAVRAGLETLLLRYGVGYGQVETVYIAGWFGYELDVPSAAEIGLLPREFIGKVKAVGNSSLRGAAEAGISRAVRENIRGICESAAEINLGADEEFYMFYVEQMAFK